MDAPCRISCAILGLMRQGTSYKSTLFSECRLLFAPTPARHLIFKHKRRIIHGLGFTPDAKEVQAKPLCPLT